MNKEKIEELAEENLPTFSTEYDPYLANTKREDFRNGLIMGAELMQEQMIYKACNYLRDMIAKESYIYSDGGILTIEELASGLKGQLKQ